MRALAQGFSVFQEAKLLVQSFPHAPDVFALLKELASMAGEPPAPVILKEGAASRYPSTTPLPTLQSFHSLPEST